MNRNAIIGIAVAALAIIYVGLSWLMGQAAHARVTAWEGEMTAKTGQLFKVAERKKLQGLFRSTEDVTLELNTAFFDAVKAAEDANDASAKASPPDPAAKPWRFTVHNDILHGPLPGFTSIGIARIESRLVLDDETAAQLKQELGVTDPFVAVTRLGLTGGGDTTITSPAFKFERKSEQVAWQGIQAKFEFARGLDSLECDARAPGLVVTKAGKPVATMEAMALDCDFERVFDELYAGDAAFTVKRLVLPAGEKGEAGTIRMEGVRYAAQTRADGDYYDMALQFGVATFAVEWITVQDATYNLSLNHLHGATLAEFARRLRESSESMTFADPAGTMAMAGLVAEHMPALLEHSPVLVVDRIGFRMPEGEFGIQGTLKVNDFKREEMAAMQSPAALLTKLEAGFDVWVSEGLLRKDWDSAIGDAEATVDNAATPSKREMIEQQVAAMEQQGYVRRNGGRLESRIEFRNGALTANGKSLGPPAR